MERHLPFFFAWTEETMGDGDAEEGREYRTAIVTERLRLRPRQAADDIAVQALAANPAIAPNLCATIPADAGGPLVIAERLTGRLIGAADWGLTGLGSGLEVALWIGEPDWGRGFATEAAQALIDHAFAEKSVGILWCSNRVTNERARRVIEKCAFQFRGSGMVRLAGRGAFPIERFALDRRNWMSLKAWGAAATTRGTRHAPRETAA
jgi:RimJ/RimL family protein N-acetyltransferase